MIKYIMGGLSLFFLLVLLYLFFRLWQECRRDRTAPGEITGEALPEALREAALRPLRQLGAYYEKRDPALADACIDETMLPDGMLILGTNPREIFQGRDGARQLLQGDWKYWGKMTPDTERTALSRADGALYFVMRGQIRLDVWRFRIPLKMTGVLEERDGLWYIAKLQFVNDLNTNYVILALYAAILLTASLLLFGLSWLF